MIKSKDKFELSNHLSLCSLLLIIILPIQSQNLVPNPSFEAFIDFNNAKSTGWHKVQISDTPDYFNLSSSNSFNNIFSDYIGGTSPKSGDGFVGIFCYRVQPERSIKNIREYIETPLITAFEKDSLYKVEVSLCLDGESNYAIKNFGVFFSNERVQLNKGFNPFTTKPQLEFNSSYLDSTDAWIILQSFYKANGSEKFVTLGNFRPDKTTTVKSNIPIKDKRKKEKWDLTKKEKSAYYYIDDVIIEKITITDQSKIITTKGLIEPDESVFNINEIKADSSIILKNIVFEFNKSELMPQSYNEINKLYQLMVSNPDIRVKLEGHTDNIGGYDLNLQLSIKRVESVTSFLIFKGINPNRIEYAGYSYSNPLVSNETDEGRAINRRVAFKIIQ
jgi:OmpA-OmpF porin, OOP family